MLAYRDHVGAIFRSRVLLGRIFRLMLRLLWLLAGFCASLSVPGSILAGSGRVRGGFWRPQGLIFGGFLALASLQFEKSPTGVLY